MIQAIRITPSPFVEIGAKTFMFSYIFQNGNHVCLF